MTQTVTSVVIVDDDQLARTGVRLMLRSVASLNVVGEAANRLELLDLLQHHQPDVILMDVMMPSQSGLSLARDIRMLRPSQRIVLMSSIENRSYDSDARNVGVESFIPKTASLDAFVFALRAGLDEKTSARSQLSDRETQVIELVASGVDNEQIAEKLHLSVNTVKTYVSRAMDKVGVSNRVQLANWMHDRNRSHD